MSPLDPGTKSRILVTGANGFVGHHVIKQLLDNTPHQVEATVRSSQQATQLQAVHMQHPRLTMHVVADITKSEAFVLASRYCHAIIHLDAPGFSGHDDYEKNLLLPAIQSVQAICHAANVNESVKRLVYCSSFAAVFDPAPEGSAPDKVYTEDDWNPATYDQVKNASDKMQAYQGSKAIAEREITKLCSEQNRWDLVSLCPGIVFGAPVEGSVSGSQELAQTNPALMSLFDEEEVPSTAIPVWTSVTSLAQAHVSALSAPKVGNERFLLINGTFDNQELCDLIRSSDLDESSRERVPKGHPGRHQKTWKADDSKAANYLKYSKPETLRMNSTT
ncbi:hypothetical protein BKA67DRAFT_659641 [Truncatella angustata]|uniref:3-beta hydroxysteroid dehydrogenase/isomerase domain-containing protein n=1 Tax=Truncatella angustata TaxID=152316 RepID=A0A9P8UIV3_9PEZI|nr:uncharacterized protein BKA67DRAFT_659641 [Truncatella angustata]KAH6652991.1 hypothetical protein BKA67DRAFT_659641 [Truncatella angustata]